MYPFFDPQMYVTHINMILNQNKYETIKYDIVCYDMKLTLENNSCMGYTILERRNSLPKSYFDTQLLTGLRLQTYMMVHIIVARSSTMLSKIKRTRVVIEIGLWWRCSYSAMFFTYSFRSQGLDRLPLSPIKDRDTGSDFRFWISFSLSVGCFFPFLFGKLLKSTRTICLG